MTRLDSSNHDMHDGLNDDVQYGVNFAATEVAGISRTLGSTASLPSSPKRLRGRLVDRDQRFGQSFGRFKVTRGLKSTMRIKFYLGDWFHSLVNTRSYRIVAAVLLVYLMLFVVFALLYMAAAYDDDDDDEEDSCFPPLSPQHNSTRHPRSARHHVWTRFIRALTFSIETMMTIGYGVDDPWFNDCPLMLFLIAAQAMVGIFSSSILFGVVLTRVMRADQRASTIGG